MRPEVKPLALFALLVLAVGAGALLGSIAGSGLDMEGNADVFAGGFLGGIVLSWVASAVAGRLGWIAREEVTATATGAAAGFLVAATVALNTLSSPVGPVLSTFLVGAGGLIGRRLRRREGKPP